MKTNFAIQFGTIGEEAYAVVEAKKKTQPTVDETGKKETPAVEPGVGDVAPPPQGVQMPTQPTSGEVGEGDGPKRTPSRGLNPLAPEWRPPHLRGPEQDRCLFVTFSNGYPLKEYQINRFFTRLLQAPCVERVYVHWPRRTRTYQQPPLFGKVVFNSADIPPLLLGDAEQAKFLIDGKPLWCKRFDIARNN